MYSQPTFPHPLCVYLALWWIYFLPMHWSSEKYWFTELCYFSKWYILFYNLKNIIFNIISNIIENFLNVESCHMCSGRYSLFKIWVFAWKANFIIANKYHQLFSLKRQADSQKKKKKVCKISKSNHLCQLFFQIKECFMEKVSNSDWTKTITQVLFLEANHNTSVCSAAVPSEYSTTSSHRIFKRQVLKSTDFIEWTHILLFCKDIFKG